MASIDVQLTVNGLQYDGWKSVQITRSIESLAGSFRLEINDRWAGSSVPWPIAEEDECALSVLGTQVLKGYVDIRDPSYDASTRSFSVAGRDKAGSLVDCSAILDKLIFRNTPILDLATKIAAPFGVKVSMQAGLDKNLKLQVGDKLAVNPGDSAHHALEKACRMVGVIPISDGQGNIVLARAGTDRAKTAIKRGVNVLKGSASYNATGRFAHYLCLSQHAGKIPKKESKGAAKTAGKAMAAAARSRGEAFDDDVRRKERTLIVNPEDGANKDYADRRAQYEATVRAAKSETLHYTVPGWAQEDGTLWPLNVLVAVDDDWLGAKGDMLITETRIGLAEGTGKTTELVLKRPDVFTPEPRIKRGGQGGKWKELVGGV